MQQKKIKLYIGLQKEANQGLQKLIQSDNSDVKPTQIKRELCRKEEGGGVNTCRTLFNWLSKWKMNFATC